MKKSLIDVPVALIFFNRPEPLEKVFEQIKLAKPSKLYLIQDGARKSNSKDEINMEKCRNIVSDIDWECEVYRNYAKENLSTGMRIYSGISWAFENEDRLVILEDDCVPSQSFFIFCEELLEKYKNDERINMISGMNHLGAHECDTSYFFSERGAIWGWATWKRVWELVDYEMSFVEDENIATLLNKTIVPKYIAKTLKKRGKSTLEKLQRGEKLTAWSYQFRMVRHLYNQLVIVPQMNMISNIGLTNDSVHASNSLRKMSKGIQRVFYMRANEIDFPLIHPKYFIADRWYDKQVDNILGEKPYIKTFRKIEGILRKLFFRE